jgi:hypothetical protein
VCVCNLSYTACNAHAPYCHLSYVRLCRIFPYYLINGTFQKKIWTQNECFDFLYNFVWSILHSKKKWTRYDQKRKLVFMQSVHYPRQILIKHEFSRQVLFKNTNMSNLIQSVLRVASCSMWTNRLTDTTKIIVVYAVFRKRPKTNDFHLHTSYFINDQLLYLKHNHCNNFTIIQYYTSKEFFKKYKFLNFPDDAGFF